MYDLVGFPLYDLVGFPPFLYKNRKIWWGLLYDFYGGVKSSKGTLPVGLSMGSREASSLDRGTVFKAYEVIT